MTNKKYYKNINIIRVFACLGILLYHLNILKGGYLAVCIFFALSSYLSTKSAFQKDKFSILNYYSNRLLKLYLPMITVIFIVTAGLNIVPHLIWLNLKPEITSILLGINNFWQLSVNLDYFARQIDSPFMHLWYISILFQFDLIFPFIYLLFRKLGDKIHKIIPLLLTSIISIISFIFFYKMKIDQNIMGAYYNTLTRAFSLFIGLGLAFYHYYYKSKTNTSKYNKIILTSGFLIITILFIFTTSNSSFMPLAMLFTTLITCKLIDSSINDNDENETITYKGIKFISNISYEIYLVQYPIIFFFQFLNITNYIKIPLIILIVIIVSYLLHFIVNYPSQSKKITILNYFLKSIIVIIYLFGVYTYITSENHTKEMNKLKDELAANEEMMQRKQEEYLINSQEDEEDWNKKLEELENGENGLKDVVTNLPVIGIGDSVMLGAAQDLYKTFPNGYFDAEVSRTAWVVNSILLNLKNNNMLKGPIILNLGTNGDCSLECKKEIIETCEGQDIFWVNVNKGDDIYFNDKLSSLQSSYENLHIIDWKSASQDHPEYFVSDQIHLTEIGRNAYVNVIYNSIYEVYLDKYKKMKEEIIKNHDDENRQKISFYGNDILLNAFTYLKDIFPDAKFVTDNNFNYKSLENKLREEINNNTLSYKIVFTFDKEANLTYDNYKSLKELCKNHEIYILSTNKELSKQLTKLNDDNIKIISFDDYSNYLMADNIHLTEDGNKKLSDTLKNSLTS